MLMKTVIVFIKEIKEWVMQHENGEIDGYENVFWNGVTCLQLAKIIEHIIRNKQFLSGVRHFFSPQTVSKYDLCKTINTVYALNMTIHKKSLPCKNMTLTSLYDFPKRNLYGRFNKYCVMFNIVNNN